MAGTNEVELIAGLEGYSYVLTSLFLSQVIINLDGYGDEGFWRVGMFQGLQLILD